ncbi:MAG: hypothetical protein Q8M73_03400 [Actinomycetota bacterium]|nr:hypothetical protein [Actinomycetota bacterium]
MNNTALPSAIRQPAAAAMAGLIFGFTLGWMLLLVHSVAPTDATLWTDWADDASRREAINLAVNLIPFAGIAFLWFIAVVRARVGSSTDRFFETVFLGSGLLFIAALFVTAAALKAILLLTDAGIELSSDTLGFAWAFGSAMLGTFGARMAAIFTLTVATTGMRSKTIPRWLAIAGYAIGILLLLTPPLPSLVQFLFPAWVVALSVLILVRSRRR